MANLVVCADGTWNTPDDTDGGLPTPTNVVKLYNALDDSNDGRKQKRYYHPGVGTGGSKVDRLIGGGIGKGLNQNIMSGYKWLSVHYRPDDDIFLFGFSRGAYTVRSLGGMIACCGLLDLSDDDIADSEVWERVGLAFECYRDPQHDRSRIRDFPFHSAHDRNGAPKPVPIRFIGVWDTVGALGIPDDLGILDLVDDPKEHEFHNTDLGESVVSARHAVAMDEMRQSFAPTLWTGYSADRDVKQIWFPGVHSDVGGGYLERGLSDAALLWMVEEAEEAGLAFRNGIKDQIRPDIHDVLHDSCTGIFSALKTQPRQVPCVRTDLSVFHSSALERHKNPPLFERSFWSTRTLKEGESEQVTVFARERWNATTIFLEGGSTYRFAAKGEWLDGGVASGPAGTSDGDFHLGEVAHVAASALGRVESVFRRITDNPKADFWATKRVEEHGWFALIGVVANGAIGAGEKNPPENELFLIAEGCDLTPKRGGYLYCFANDAWHAYDNNRGSVSLTVTRL